MIRWFHVEPQGVDPCAYVPGLYTQSQVDDLINIDGYIPVADAAEFDKIRTGAVETMGGCSIWAGSYTTGGDKKYLQIFNLDFVDIAYHGTIQDWSGTYDGNELNISNYVGNAMFENIAVPAARTARNIRVLSPVVTNDVGQSLAVIDRNAGGNGSLFDNIIITGASVTNTTLLDTILFGTSGICGVTVDTGSNLTINDCHFSGTIICNTVAASIIGITRITASITNCTSTNTIINRSNLSTDSGDSGGMVGRCETAALTISNCSISNSTLTLGGQRCGGFIGVDLSVLTITSCFVNNCTMSFNGARIVGGFIGVLQSAGSVIEKSYTTGSSTQTGTTSENGGFVGLNLRTIRECYADVDVTSPSASGTHFGSGGFVGENRTTGLIEDCYAYGTVLGRNEVGGFAGRGNGTIRYSYSTGAATGTTNVGGFIGRVTTTNSQTAAYWDTVTSGNATSAGAGTSGQTTSALQTPTSNTGIYSAWSLAIWDFGTSVEYPELINTP